MHVKIEEEVGEETLNANGLLPVIDNPVLSFSVTRNVATVAAGAVKKNVNVEPPFVEASDTAPLPEGPYVGVIKSVIRAVV